MRGRTGSRAGGGPGARVGRPTRLGEEGDDVERGARLGDGGEEGFEEGEGEVGGGVGRPRRAGDGDVELAGAPARGGGGGGVGGGGRQRAGGLGRRGTRPGVRWARAGREAPVARRPARPERSFEAFLRVRDRSYDEDARVVHLPPRGRHGDGGKGAGDGATEGGPVPKGRWDHRGPDSGPVHLESERGEAGGSPLGPTGPMPGRGVALSLANPLESAVGFLVGTGRRGAQRLKRPRHGPPRPTPSIA